MPKTPLSALTATARRRLSLFVLTGTLMAGALPGCADDPIAAPSAPAPAPPLASIADDPQDHGAERPAPLGPDVPPEAASPMPASASPASAVEAPAAQPLPAPGSAAPGRYGERDDVRLWAQDVAARQGLDAAWVRAAIGSARYQAAVARAVLPAPVGTPKNWSVYRSRFVEPRRIRAAAAFWQAHREWLALAEQRYGVPQHIIVGLIGVETIYGQQVGSWRVLDALSTLAFDYPAGAPRNRSAFFRAELEQFLLLCRERGSAPQDALGSYAGAIGLPQFMPSSWRRWAVDFDGDGRIDLWRSAADAIGSVANYLVQHGWQADQPTHYPVQIPSDARALARLLEPDIRPTFTAATMQELGATLPGEAFEHAGLLALVKLENGSQTPIYVAGTQNFYAITRYNQSSLYAMAVIELGSAAQRAR